MTTPATEPTGQHESGTPAAADPPAPEREAVPEPAHTGASGDEQRTNMLTALEELGQVVSSGLENINKQIAEMRGGPQGTDETPQGVPWTHRGRRAR